LLAAAVPNLKEGCPKGLHPFLFFLFKKITFPFKKSNLPLSFGEGYFKIAALPPSLPPGTGGREGGQK